MTDWSRLAGRRSRFARLPTGSKVLVIISIALLPLALIAMLATLQTTRIANVETRARLRVAAMESARAIGIELLGDTTALRSAVVALDRDPLDAPGCARVRGVFAQQTPAGTRFAIIGRTGAVLCGARFPGMPTATAAGAEPSSFATFESGGLVVGTPAAPGRGYAAVYYPAPFLAGIGRPSGGTTAYGEALTLDDDQLTLANLAADGGLDRRETLNVPLGIAGLALQMQVHAAPITASLVLAMLLPLLIWAAAALVSWLVVDRLLIRPLRQLRTSVAAFVPGEVIEPGNLRHLPAQEIRDLGDTFRAISRTVALHEAGLAEGLLRQTKLTREVHHRVKNNLQVISSLINIHARGARSGEASDAYATIQRRVDALAVVHRNHFAEAEENRGLNLRAMIGELASNIRATAPEGGAQPRIVLDVEPLMVNQDVAVAVAFLLTEMIELAMGCDAAAAIHASVRAGDDVNRAVLRVSSRALSDSEAFRAMVAQRYGRVLEGLSRQLRAPLHHDALVGAYEIAFAAMGRS